MDVNVVVKAPNYYEGALVSFRAEAAGGKSYAWDFNDGKTSESNLASVQHSFPSPGIYYVSVVVNGHCEGFDTVTIVERPLDKSPLLEPSFIAPDTATVNRPITFTDTTSDATSWKWRCGEGDLVDGINQKISYTYKTPGIKVVYLEINGRPDRASTRTIYVKDEQPLVQMEFSHPKPKGRIGVYPVPNIRPKPTGPALGDSASGSSVAQPPPPKKYTDVQADEVIILLQGVVTGEKKAADFTQYFCDGSDIPVTYNATPMKFSQMCNILSGIKKLKKIEKPEVQLIKNSSSNCINRMIVTVMKAGFFDRHFKKS